MKSRLLVPSVLPGALVPGHGRRNASARFSGPASGDPGACALGALPGVPAGLVPGIGAAAAGMLRPVPVPLRRRGASGAQRVQHVGGATP